MNRLRKLMLFCCVTILMGIASAQNFELNLVNFTLKESDWVNTEQCLLKIKIDAVAQEGTVADVRKKVVEKLGELITGKWHITEVSMNKDKTGLSKLSLLAEIRPSQSQVTSLPKRLSSLSKPGTQYQLASLSFVPSTEEIQSTIRRIRDRLYAKAAKEVVAINQRFPNQAYFLHQLSIDQQTTTPVKPPILTRLNAIQPQALQQNANDVTDETSSYRLNVVARVVLASQILPTTHDRNDD